MLEPTTWTTRHRMEDKPNSKNIDRIAMKEKLRNISYLPYLGSEGTLSAPMPRPPPVSEGELWYAHLRPYERLYYHQTLSSLRSCRRFVPTSRLPRDSLEYKLQSRYDHAREYFPEKVDTVLQRETCHSHKTPSATFRVLRNTKTIIVPEPHNMGHPLQIGGLTERISPFSVKLINSGVHTQLVNNGFSRQPADGNFFRY